MTLFLATLAAEGSGSFNPLDIHAGGNLLWTLVIFLLALAPIWKFVMGPVTRGLLDRDQAANQAIEAAERASQDAEKARAEVEVKLGEAQAEAARILGEARERGESREREIVEAAKAEAATLVDNARRAIRAEQDRAIAAIRSEVVDLSLSAAGKVLETKVDGESDRRLVESLVGSVGEAQ